MCGVPAALSVDRRCCSLWLDSHALIDVRGCRSASCSLVLMYVVLPPLDFEEGPLRRDSDVVWLCCVVLRKYVFTCGGASISFIETKP